MGFKKLIPVPALKYAYEMNLEIFIKMGLLCLSLAAYAYKKNLEIFIKIFTLHKDVTFYSE
jgi:hypothetical protein